MPGKSTPEGHVGKVLASTGSSTKYRDWSFIYRLVLSYWYRDFFLVRTVLVCAFSQLL